jgi:hypothetical protein
MPKPRAPNSSPYLARRRWTAADAEQVLAALERSGLELTAFALSEGLDPQRVSRWRRRLASPAAPVFEEFVRPGPAEGQAGEVTVGAGREWFEIVLRTGRVVRVPESFDASALRRLLEVVEEGGPC